MILDRFWKIVKQLISFKTTKIEKVKRYTAFLFHSIFKWGQMILEGSGKPSTGGFRPRTRTSLRAKYFWFSFLLFNLVLHASDFQTTKFRVQHEFLCIWFFTAYTFLPWEKIRLLKQDCQTHCKSWFSEQNNVNVSDIENHLLAETAPYYSLELTQ